MATNPFYKATTLGRSTVANPFGLTNAALLEQTRDDEDKKVINESRAMGGGNFAATVAGLSLGNALRGALINRGLYTDPQADRAQEVTTAQKAARERTQAEPPANPKDIYATQTAYGLNLISELTTAGLYDEADSVRQQLMAMDKQKLELRKLEGAVTGGELTNTSKEIDNRIKTATEDATIVEKRSQAVSATVSANAALDTASFTVPKAQAEQDLRIQVLAHNKVMNPYVEQRAKDDATIGTMMARMGGAVPELVKLQTQRDNVLQAIADNPNADNKARLQTVREINERIQTTTMGIQRNMDNWQPTNAVKTEIQNGLVQMAGFSAQAKSILVKLETATSDPFGIDADTKVALAGLANKVLSFAGSQTMADSVSDAIADDNTLMVRSEARQLKADLMQWFSNSRAANKTTTEQADHILQVFDTPTVDRKQARIALTNFIGWIADKQKTNYEVLDQNIRAVSPHATQSLEDTFSNWANQTPAEGAQ